MSGSEEEGLGSATGWHSYRCPVCAHVDEVRTSEAAGWISCSHCGTELELEVRSADRTAVASRVALRRRRRR